MTDNHYIFLQITYSTLRNIQSVVFVISKLCNKNDVSQTVDNLADVTNENIVLLISYFRNKCL